MQMSLQNRWPFLLLLILSTCLLVTSAPASLKPPVESVVIKQPSYIPNFKESNPNIGSADNRRPAYNPNYKHGGPPPPYSPAGQPPPNVPGGPPPPYQPNQPPPYGSPGQRPPYAGQPGVRPFAYPGQPAPYPVQPRYPGAYPQQTGVNHPYPFPPDYTGGYPHQPGVNRPYPVQSGYHQQPGVNRPYPVQPGVYNSPYPQQSHGGNVWQPHFVMPSPVYINYGGIPIATNMYSNKQNGFLGSFMSKGTSKYDYYGSYPSPYGVGGMGGGSFGHMGGRVLGNQGSSAAIYTILPYMAPKKAPKELKPRFGDMPTYLRTPYHRHHHHHYGHEIYPNYADYYDVYDSDYVGKCQQPIKKNHTEIECKVTYDEINCDAKCEDGYQFPQNIILVTNKCWHMTGVWRPKKNFPDCTPVCEEGCMNGGVCLRPGVCKCQSKFIGEQCQFRKTSWIRGRMTTVGEARDSDSSSGDEMEVITYQPLPTLNFYETMIFGQVIDGLFSDGAIEIIKERYPKVKEMLVRYQDEISCDGRVLTKGTNANWVCDYTKNVTECKISCEAPLVFDSPPANEYTCTSDGKWTPDTTPRCVAKETEAESSVAKEWWNK